MLCELAHDFPPRIAEFLERDRKLTRNFREESVTDMLMASMVGLQSLGIRVDFPDEPSTGGDMEWIYAAPLEISGGRYLRLILQAKRAKYVTLKSSGYWFYEHLDHGDPAGSQAKTLISHANSSAAGMTTLPFYIFYHPTSATMPAARKLPAIEGINLVFADLIEPVVRTGCKRADKKVSRWRSHFLPLSDLLCWPIVTIARPPPAQPGVTQFLVDGVGLRMPPLTSGFHPDIVTRRLNQRRERPQPVDKVEVPPPRFVEPAEGIPGDIRRAIEGKMTMEDRQRLKRPRVILTTSLTRESSDFPALKQQS